MTAEEKEALLAEYHPDYKDDGLYHHPTSARNKGEKVPV